MLPDIQPGNTKILYFFNCLLDGMHTTKPEFCDFALWNPDCNLASSFSSKVVLSGRMERLAQRNKIKLRITPSFLNPSDKPVTLSPTVTSVTRKSKIAC